MMYVRENSSYVYVDSSFSYFLTVDNLLNTLYLIPGTDSTLSKNTEYTITISSGLSGVISNLVYTEPLQEDYTFWFTSQYCPLFTSLNRVRIEAGPVADALADDTIYRMILKNSQDAVDIYNLSASQSNTYTTWGCGPGTDIPFLLRRYVECKTAYDILALMEMVGSSNADQLKTLGDLTIRYSGPSGSASASDPGKKKQLLDCWQQLLNSLNGIKSAVRGWYDTSKMTVHPSFTVKHNRVSKPEWAVATPGSTPGTRWRRTF
jgi:hypothetical protein